MMAHCYRTPEGDGIREVHIERRRENAVLTHREAAPDRAGSGQLDAPSDHRSAPDTHACETIQRSSDPGKAQVGEEEEECVQHTQARMETGQLSVGDLSQTTGAAGPDRLLLRQLRGGLLLYRRVAIFYPWKRQ